MNIEMRGSTLPISEALERHIARRLEFALRKFADKLGPVVVRLVDLNGPKGGIDKRCRIAARLASGAPSVVVESTDADVYAAISRAAARLADRVARARSMQTDRVHNVRERRARGAALHDPMEAA